MGQHAMDAMIEAMDFESDMYDYMSGQMSYEDAYESGILHAIDKLSDKEYNTLIRSVPTSWDEMHSALRAETLKLDSNSYNSYNPCFDYDKVGVVKYEDEEIKQYLNRLRSAFPNLNGAAIINLFKDAPTCNHCEELMGEQLGRFGKFYFCINGCKEQKTVSESYWLKLKERLNNVER